jgi:hypothetical protein
MKHKVTGMYRAAFLCIVLVQEPYVTYPCTT